MPSLRESVHRQVLEELLDALIQTGDVREHKDQLKDVLTRSVKDCLWIAYQAGYTWLAKEYQAKFSPVIRVEDKDLVLQPSISPFGYGLF